MIFSIDKAIAKCDISVGRFFEGPEKPCRVHIISNKRLKEFYAVHNQAEGPLDDWYRKLSKLNPQNLAELKLTFPRTDLIGNCYVFDVGGNKYRVITKIYFEQQTVLVRFVLTHKEYDEDTWKTDC